MFKSWHIFFFSLVPLALVLAGVIVGSVHFSGGDSAAEVFPTAAPRTSTAPAATPIPGATALQLKAQNIAFTPRALTATAGQPVQLQFDNADAGVIHNIAFFTSAAKSTLIYRGPLEAGAKVTTLSFTAPTAPGSYFFVCEAHPDTMTGTFTVR